MASCLGVGVITQSLHKASLSIVKNMRTGSASGRAPDPDVGFQPCGFYEPQHAIDRDLLQAP